ncbi:hypothetical protein [Gryllotalpicola koreensis]|uniref:Uncharacterized protein n=1 Tax=Gryllotalpicola koreensis TaxID=993086 RepID=A0ABP7ZT60_9MICO
MQTETIRRNRKRAGIWASSIAVGALVAGSITVGLYFGHDPADAEPATNPAAVSHPITPNTDGPHESTIWDAQVWAMQNFGNFNAETHHGEGDALITLPEGARAGLLTGRHTGDGAFELRLRDANNAIVEEPVNTSGDYRGTTAWGVHDSREATTLQIVADGSWSITISPVAGAGVMPSTGNGQGDAVFLYDGTWRGVNAVHNGTGEFEVRGYTEDPLATVNILTHTGPYSGTALLPSVPAVITVSSEGTWQIVRH